MYKGGMGGPMAYNALDCPAGLPSGTFAAREILNLLCLASPNRTFHVSVAHEGLWVTPLTCVGYKLAASPTPGALFYWRTEVNPFTQGAPTDSELVDALTSKEVRIRAAARNYLDMALPLSQMNALVSQGLPAERLVWVPETLRPGMAHSQGLAADRAVWVAVAVLSVMTRADVPAWPPAAARLKQVLAENALSDKPALQALAAMEFARVEKDGTLLEQAAKRPLSALEIADVAPDTVRNLRYSAFVRKKLLELSPEWAGFSKAQIESLGQTNIFSLP